MVTNLCIISGCIFSGKCAVKPGPADIHINSHGQAYSSHKASECVNAWGSAGASADVASTSLWYPVYFTDYADRIAHSCNCIRLKE